MKAIGQMIQAGRAARAASENMPSGSNVKDNADGTRTFTARPVGMVQKASDLFQGNPSAAPFTVVSAKRGIMNPSSAQKNQDGGYEVVQ